MCINMYLWLNVMFLNLRSTQLHLHPNSNGMVYYNSTENMVNEIMTLTIYFFFKTFTCIGQDLN